ncbi:tetraacyldisaccharide 4'-kinase [Aggregatibacter actinomycetemcomitans]|uniref:tetraacyldisaccharide 4'-kinase n=1 Tax=Aggregatibacter actinomycetemcomitans TaxID=714 RepID=UPI00022BFF83|nr:tetraacyldisaccharide 4'-kinase [Aggregatibacter actinomycetemcomitans]AEW77509.1 tetraacyldisaccharide 4'-kinase [Aggregatibacter actinomycetemcomitans ANH9381]AMQ91646.1 tetraacyldisaccharide 4'-kinase [Aggregatibacter actinomycetemcomitans]KOE53340.1 tetraacyldisaccharide 4'-kinase [Aggregatibacter actinomycetemcomitans serotype b str. S23A]KOE53455.1 tetraacyldisaccharide 4'-kinase [Aggregatibacter actinomycetemcomitans serotype b str. I23C]TYA23350.1 tetraacyldisaccharide 4'-kinase [Ag
MQFWYSRSWITWLLCPFSLLFWLITAIRRALFRFNLLKSYRAPVPVVVVGNLSVGGNGKTPAVIWLVQELSKRGLKVGVISRGYGSQAKHYPLLVTPPSDPVEAGDEPVLIATRTQAPVCISPNRQQAVEYLLEHAQCDVIISDDGLQHYKLQRDIEVVIMDAQRGLGNGFLLPAGPLRELPSRLKSVDFVVTNGAENQYSDAVMTLQPQYAVNLVNKAQYPLKEFSQATAIAGIGNPPRFFAMLQQQGIILSDIKAFQDHQRFSADLFNQFDKNQPLLMTEKDAVKCLAFAQENWWYVPVTAEIHGEKARQLIQKIVQKCGEK